MADINAEQVIVAEFRNRDGVLADPDTVKGWILPPGAASSIPLVFVRNAAGQYESTFTPTLEGRYKYRVESTGAVKTADERFFDVEGREVPLPLPTAIPQIPIISRGLPAFVSSGTFGAPAVDGAYASLWASQEVTTPQDPAWLVIDLRSVVTTAKKRVWAVIKSKSTTYYDGGVLQGIPNSSPGHQNTSNYGAMPRNYLLQASAAASLPAPSDPSWTTLITVVDNTYHTRVFQNLDLSTYNWFRIYVTDSNGVIGFSDDVALEIDLRDVSVSTQDSFFEYGDSITNAAFAINDPLGGFWLHVGPLEDSVEIQTNRWAPVSVDGATIGWTAVDGDNFKADYIPTTPCHYVMLNFGSNDANVAGVDLNTLGGLNSTYVKGFKTHLQSMVNYCVSLGKICIIPHIPWGNLNSWTVANLTLLNTIIDQVVAANPNTVLAGPDFFAFFQTNPNLLVDHLHPTSDTANPAGLLNGQTGYEHYLQMWIDWMIQHFYT